MTLYQHIIDGCLPAPAGDGGVTNEKFQRMLDATQPALVSLRAAQTAGDQPLLRLPERRDDLTEAQAIAQDWRNRFTDVVILGTGGSSLGGQTLYNLVDCGFGPPPGTPRLHFMDNIDPNSFTALTSTLDLKRSGLIIISKSGSTPETMIQARTLLPVFEQALGHTALANHAVIITEAKPSPLRDIAAHYALTCLDHDPDIGGRFAALSIVGLLPAMIAGLDAAAIRSGAGTVLQAVLDAAKPDAAAPAVGAALAVTLLREKAISQSVLMPYADRLAAFGSWYRQLWAESLGKNGQGTTPIRALGTVDQHSQLQLYLDGPADKMFTLILCDTTGQGPRVDDETRIGDDLDYLTGHSLGDLLDAEARATAETLIRHGRPVRIMRLATLNEAAIGALMMHFMLETIIAADLFGVSPYGQPAVEEGKRLARQYLGSKDPGTKIPGTS